MVKGGRVVIWAARIYIGVFWDGPDYHLCYGTRKKVDRAARRHLIKFPYRRAHIYRVAGAFA